MELIHDQLEEMGSGEMFDVNQKRITKELIYFEIVYWKESLLHSLNPGHRYNCLILQLTNYPIFPFIERVQSKDPTLFSGLSHEDILYITHEPALPSTDSVLRLYKILTSQSQNQDVLTANYAQVQQILLFETTNRVLLKDFSLTNNFLEILTEVKLLFQTYLLLYYYSRLCKDLQSKELRGAIRLCCINAKDASQASTPLSQNNVSMSVALEGNALYLFISPDNGRMDFNIEPANKTVEVHKNRLKVYCKRILIPFCIGNIITKTIKFHRSDCVLQEDFAVEYF